MPLAAASGSLESTHEHLTVNNGDIVHPSDDAKDGSLHDLSEDSDEDDVQDAQITKAPRPAYRRNRKVCCFLPRGGIIVIMRSGDVHDMRFVLYRKPLILKPQKDF